MIVYFTLEFELEMCSLGDIILPVFCQISKLEKHYTLVL